ncbi:MAG: hypothetical protein ACJAT2_002818 [Bacteriovoracaceae bacterium]|jgi:hypothetical protein
MDSERLYMITMTLVNIFLYVSVNLYASTGDVDWSALSSGQIEEYLQLQEANKRGNDLDNLKTAKDFLINGNTKMARFHLEQINLKNSPVKLIRNRYMSIIEFIEGNYRQSLNLINSGRYDDEKYYKEVCMIRVLNRMALHTLDQDRVTKRKVDREFLNEYRNCSVLTLEYSKNQHYWLDTMSRFKTRNKEYLKGSEIENVSFAISSLDLTRIWLKLGLYLNKEELVKANIKTLPAKMYQSNSVRELLGLMYYRLNDLEKANEFVEGITSPNAENIKGNIRLKNKEYELAFGHFKVALLKKENSINALERAIPLAWLLGQWEEGIKLLSRFIKPGQDERKKLALDTAFKIKIEDYKKAEEQLFVIERLFKRQVPQEVEIMKSYVALRRKKMKDLAESSSIACKRHDGVNCWIQMQMSIWENLGYTIEREENIFSDDELDIESLKEMAGVQPLKESVIIDQKDIEELDSQKLQIDPTLL